jgi:hypothetical protein
MRKEDQYALSRDQSGQASQVDSAEIQVIYQEVIVSRRKVPRFSSRSP